MTWIIVATVAITVLAVVIAFNFATPEKELERKVTHHYSIDDPQFRREMSVMMGPSLLPGNRVTVLNNGDEIFSSMLEAIRGAKVSITFETYIYWSGQIGEEFTEALSERARAGIPVHVTVDWVGSIKMDPSLLHRMEAAGVQLKRYRPLKWYNLGRMNNRTHRKLLVVDGRTGFTGGVGVADQWRGNAQDPDHWRDIHFRIEGPAVAQIQVAFNDNWIKSTGEVLNGPKYFPPLQPAGDIDAHLIIASPAGGSESMHLMYLMAIAAAAKSIDLSASYFLPDPLIIGTLLAARGRGVRIRVLVPGAYIDSDAVRLTTKSSWGELLEAGVEIHEYQPTMIHNKLLIIDQELVSAGSTNFDIRSFQLNDEASLNVYDHEFAARMTRVFERDLEHARRYTHEAWRKRPWTEKLTEKVMLPIKSQL